MIHYQLRCADGHGFEGWFRDSAAFEMQAKTGLLTCPSCGSTRVDRGLMAPAVRTRRASVPAADKPASVPAAAATVAPGPDPGSVPAEMPDQLRAVLQRMRVAVERNCDHVGDDFAGEALRMHRGEATVRGIYGNATEEDREVLADEGIEIVQIPWLKPADS